MRTKRHQSIASFSIEIICGRTYNHDATLPIRSNKPGERRTKAKRKKESMKKQRVYCVSRCGRQRRTKKHSTYKLGSLRNSFELNSATISSGSQNKSIICNFSFVVFPREAYRFCIGGRKMMEKTHFALSHSLYLPLTPHLVIAVRNNLYECNRCSATWGSIFFFFVFVATDLIGHLFDV